MSSPVLSQLRTDPTQLLSSQAQPPSQKRLRSSMSLMTLSNLVVPYNPSQKKLFLNMLDNCDPESPINMSKSGDQLSLEMPGQDPYGSIARIFADQKRQQPLEKQATNSLQQRTQSTTNMPAKEPNRLLLVFKKYCCCLFPQGGR